MTTRSVISCALLAACATGVHAQTVRSGSAADAAGLQAIVDQFRDDLGQLNAPEPGSQGTGRRQINWDAAPDAVSAPNNLPGDFFNANFAPRARGVVFSTPGSGFQLSATAASGVGVRFGNINSAYENQFSTFSDERLFTALDSNIVDVDFRVPGSDEQGLSRGFGAVFSDVDIWGSTFIDYYDVNGDKLGSYTVETGPTEDGSLSFLGVSFDDVIVASVRIYSGNQALGGLEYGGIDLVVMDDFIFGEPVAVPAPGVLALASAGLLVTRRRRRG
ncbi:MAG: hypothetical protein AAGB51_10825 [Planctomycetota bacterium]